MNRPTFAVWLTQQITSREWTASDFARKLGKHPPTVSRWLNGQTQPDTASCDLIADVLNADLDYVLMLAGHRPGTLPADETLTRLQGKLSRLRLTPDAVIPLEALLDGLLAAQKGGRGPVSGRPGTTDPAAAVDARSRHRAPRAAAD